MSITDLDIVVLLNKQQGTIWISDDFFPIRLG